LPRLLADSDVDVQIAACHLAEKLNAPELGGPVLAVLRNAKEHWQLNAASNAAFALGARGECMRTLADRLDDEEVAAWCLGHLVSAVLTGTNGWGSPTKMEKATGQVCKKEWQQFLKKHGERLAKGKKFKLSDPTVPLEKLFPGYRFEGR
jgi:hypothetical protein